MISSIYGSSKGWYKVGERKGKKRDEIQKLEDLKTKKPKPKYKTKPKVRNNNTIILKENETIRDGEIVQIKDKTTIGAKRKKKASNIFKQYKQLFR